MSDEILITGQWHENMPITVTVPTTLWFPPGLHKIATKGELAFIFKNYLPLKILKRPRCKLCCEIHTPVP